MTIEIVKTGFENGKPTESTLGVLPEGVWSLWSQEDLLATLTSREPGKGAVIELAMQSGSGSSITEILLRPGHKIEALMKNEETGEAIFLRAR